MNSLEHALIILLLLVGLLNSQVLRGYWWLVLGAILALAMISPVFPLPLPWSWLAGLIIPLLFWQTAYRLVHVRVKGAPAELILWILLALSLAAALWWVGGMAFTGALLFGILISSMAWRATEPENRTTYLGQIGALALAFLLAEIRPEGETLSRFLYLLAGGAFIGSVTGYLTARAAERATPGWKRNLLSLAQGYLAYGLALTLGFSPVAASITSILVYIDSGFRRGLWERGQVSPRPLANQAVFVALLVALAFLAWQSHVPLSSILLIDLILALAIVAVFVFLGRRFNFPSFQSDQSLTNVFIRVSFLVPPALLLWPREAFLQPEPIAIALLAAAITIILTYVGLSPLLNLYTYLENSRTISNNAEDIFTRLLVDDLLVTVFPSVTPDTRIEELTRLLSGNENACLPVLNGKKGLLGVITQADLFFKEQTAPRSSLTYITLFGEAVLSNQFAGAYISRTGSRRASDVMTEDVICVEQGSRADDAVRLMVQGNLHCIPVMSGDPKDAGNLIGLFTRSNLIRSLSEEKQLRELRLKLAERELRGD